MPDHAESSNEKNNEAHAQLLNFLHERDVNCPTCQYNLRNLTSDTCPECGEVIELRIGSTSGMRTWALVGTISMALGAGFQVSLALLIAIVTFFRGMPPRGIGLTAVVAFVFFLFHSVILMIWIRQHHQIARRNTNRVKRIAILMLLATLSLAGTIITVFVYGMNT